MSTKADHLALVEAAYRLDQPTPAWFEGLLVAFAQVLGCPARAAGACFDARRPDWIDLNDPVGLDLPLPLLARTFSQAPASEAHQRRAVALFRRGYFGVISELLSTFFTADYSELLARSGIADFTGLIAADPTHTGCFFMVVSPSHNFSPRTRYMWRKLGMHVTAGLRLRRQLADLVAAAGDPADRAEAVLTTASKIEHAVGDAATRDGQQALRDGLARIEAARGERRYDGERAIDLWTGLITGRWSLVEHFERGGRRYFLAYKNDPKLPPSRALTDRELQVWSYAAMGQSNKLIAYALGLSVPTVAGYLRQARRKLGADVGPQVLATLASDRTPE